MQQARACRDDSVPTSRISVLVTVKFKQYRVCCALPELVTPFALTALLFIISFSAFNFVSI